MPESQIDHYTFKPAEHLILQDTIIRLHTAKSMHADLLQKVKDSESNVSACDASVAAVVRTFAQLNGLDGAWTLKPDGTGLVRA